MTPMLADGPRSWVYALVLELGLLPRPALVDHLGDRCPRAHACTWQIRTHDGARYVFSGPTSVSGLRDALRYLDVGAGPTIVDALEFHPSRGRYDA